MEGETRREAILAHLEAENKPVSGSRLSQLFGVSRQVIVQDNALIRATNKNILSTNKGYVLYKPEHISTKCKRIFPVFHTTKQIKKELYTIVDLGGTVLDVIVEHDVYGMITVDLILKNRTDVDEFLDKLHESHSQPLNVLTNGFHYHSVTAASEEILDKIEQALQEKGFLK